MQRFKQLLASLERIARAGDQAAMPRIIRDLQKEHEGLQKRLQEQVRQAKRMAESKKIGEKRFIQALKIFQRLQDDIRRIQSIHSLEEIPEFLSEMRVSMGLSALRLVLDADMCGDVCPQEMLQAHPKDLTEFALALNDISSGETSYIGPASTIFQLPNAEKILNLRPDGQNDNSSCFVRLLFDKYRPTLFFGVLALLDKDPGRFTPAQATDFLEHYCYLLSCNLTTLMDHERLVRRSTIDPLTKAHNRNYLVLHAQRLLDFAERKGFPVCLLFIDLDRFKRINDSLGHDVGDKVLIHVAEQIRSMVRKQDIFVRMGGDEFIVLLTDASTDQVGRFRKRISRAIEDIDVSSLAGSETRLRIGASIGVAAYAPGMSVEDLLVLADREMYREKDRHNGHPEQVRQAKNN